MTRVFKETPPPEIIWELLEEICYIEDGHYIVNYEAYKKLFYLELDLYLFDSLVDYYKPEFLDYISDDLIYRRFLTIIRQVCKENGIPCLHEKIKEGGLVKQFYRVSSP